MDQKQGRFSCNSEGQEDNYRKSSGFQKQRLLYIKQFQTQIVSPGRVAICVLDFGSSASREFHGVATLREIARRWVWSLRDFLEANGNQESLPFGFIATITLVFLGLVLMKEVSDDANDS